MDIELLKEFLFNAESELKFDMVPLIDIIENMKALGFPEEDYEHETNGWQCDFWLDFTKEGYPYKVTFTGSLFYGGYCVSKELLS